MNAIDLLKQDHDVVDELFKRIEDTPPSKHTPIFKKIKNELDTHAHIEEKIFYPTLKAKGDKELVDITAEGLQEHSQIKKFLKEIARSTSKDTREAKLKVLIEDTRHHVKEEENDMFPMVNDQFSSEELDKLGQRMEAEKKKFQKAKRIPARREPPKGAVTSVIEKAKEFVMSAFAGGSDSQGSTGRKAGARKISTSATGSAKSGGRSSGAKGSGKRSSSGKAAGKTASKPSSAKKAGSNGKAAAKSGARSGSSKSDAGSKGSSRSTSGSRMNASRSSSASKANKSGSSSSRPRSSAK